MTGSSESRPNPLVVPVFATAAFLAGLVGVWGFTSLLLNRDVIDYPDAGLFLGPAIAVTACLVTFSATMGARRSPTPLLYGALTVLAAFAIIVLVGAVGYSLVRANFGVIPASALHFALSPFMIAAALLCGIVVAGAGLLSRPRRA